MVRFLRFELSRRIVPIGCTGADSVDLWDATATGAALMLTSASGGGGASRVIVCCAMPGFCEERQHLCERGLLCVCHSVRACGVLATRTEERGDICGGRACCSPALMRA